jgi:hypothetical protein
MTTQAEYLQNLWKRYEKENLYEPTGTREVAEWAVREGLIRPPTVDPLDVLAGQFSRALREEYATDAHGSRYRVNHAVRISKNGVQHTFWGIMGFANHSHMERAFAQRREQVIGDCLQLKIDVDVYNEKNPAQEPIQLILDFTEDVAERQAA